MRGDSRRGDGCSPTCQIEVCDEGPQNSDIVPDASFQHGSQWPEEICNSGQDIDGDGDTDCADPDCEGQT